MRRRSLAAIVAAAVVVLALGVAAVLLLTGRAGEAPGPAPQPVPQAIPGGFEGDPARAGWVLTAGDGVVSPTTTKAHSGSASLQLTGTEGGAPASAALPRLPVVPGRTYAAGAFSLVGTGRQELVVQFRDGAGQPITDASAPTGTTTGAWSRVSTTATAPPGAASATLTLTAIDGVQSAVSWDDVSFVDSAVPNGGVEAEGPDSSCPQAWTCVAPAGSDSARTTSERHSGAAALLLTDGSADEAVTAVTGPVQVAPSVGQTFSAWVLVDSGEPTAGLTVRWYDAARTLLATDVHDGLRTDAGAWTQVEVTDPAPDTAAYATVEVHTSATGQGRAVWDDVAVEPAPGTGPQRWSTERVAQLDGFTTTATSRVLNVGGRPKLATIVSGDPASLQIADVQTGTVDDVRRLPGLVHGWGLTESADGRSLYVGGGSGHLLRYDPATKSLTDLGRATPRARLVFDLATGPDGRVWGASYPGGEVWAYDPATQAFTVLDPVGSGHDYARSIAVDRDWVYVGTGSVNPDIVRISAADPSRRTTIALPDPVASGFVVSLDLHGRYLAARLPEGRRGVYDTVSQTWDVPLSQDAGGRQIQQTPTSTTVDGAPFYYFTNGRLWRVDPQATGPAAKRAVATVAAPEGRDRAVVRTRIGGVDGDWILSFDGVDTVTALNVSALPPATGASLPAAPVRTLRLHLRPSPVPIKSLAVGSRGEVLVGGFGGSSLSMLDPADPQPRLTPLISDPVGRDVFGEVEGMVSNGRFDFFGSYTSARLFRRDSTLPWVDGENPRLLATLGPTLGQDRPLAWATSGDRTVFGTVPQYGRLGGVLGWFDGADTTPQTVWCPVPDQSVVALAGAGHVAYGGTSRWGGLGVRPSTASAELFAYDLESRQALWHVAPLPGAQAFTAVLLDSEGRLWAATSTTLVELDRASGRVRRTLPLLPGAERDEPTYRGADLAELDGRVVVAAQGRLYAVDPDTLAVDTIASRGVAPAKVRAIDGLLYFPSRSVLLRATSW
ncbi:MAG TPA: hypothetical protein VFJ94_01145 [Intrasporangium sp.]|uniref:hypothetical protein n=1 Tax=Intrasporangium sp. TaxID=1925024 RepID=UPI002D7A4070|nr:hypothetical protein [Intrasporangium sp.]HET7397097.1 hypothetical protein [Intrasporangium sp.]